MDEHRKSDPLLTIRSSVDHRPVRHPAHHYALWGIVGLAYGLGLGGMAFGPFWSGVLHLLIAFVLHATVRRILGGD